METGHKEQVVERMSEHTVSVGDPSDRPGKDARMPLIPTVCLTTTTEAN